MIQDHQVWVERIEAGRNTLSKSLRFKLGITEKVGKYLVRNIQKFCPCNDQQVEEDWLP